MNSNKQQVMDWFKKKTPTKPKLKSIKGSHIDKSPDPVTITKYDTSTLIEKERYTSTPKKKSLSDLIKELKEKPQVD